MPLESSLSQRTSEEPDQWHLHAIRAVSRGRFHAKSDASSSPISHLPEDVLHELFFTVVAIVAGEDYWSHRLPTGTHRTKLYKWIVISRVCRRWRGIILNSPRLWTFVAFAQRSGLPRIALERSGNAKLCLLISDFGLDWPLYPENMDLILMMLRELRRARFLRMGYSGTLSKHSFDSELTAAPFLEAIHLEFDQHYFLPSLYSSLTDFFGRLSLPRLGTVTLRDPTPKACEYLARHSLTYLEIHQTSSTRGYSEFTRVFFLKLLKGLPLIERLYLKVNLRTSDETPFSVTLPRLKTFTLQGSDHDCASVLEHLSFPPPTVVNIKPDHPTGYTERTLNRLWKLNLASCDPPLRLSIKPDGMCSSFIFKLRSLKSRNDPATAPSPYLSIQLRCNLPRKYAMYVEDVFSQLSTQDIQVLHVHDTFLVPADWINTKFYSGHLGVMSQVTSLVYEGTDAFRFLRSLRPTRDLGVSQVPFPHLKRLELRNVFRNDQDDDDEDPEESIDVVFEMLYDALKSRKDEAQVVEELSVVTDGRDRVANEHSVVQLCNRLRSIGTKTRISMKNGAIIAGDDL